jgi:DNA-binding response OmpR family regulator
MNSLRHVIAVHHAPFVVEAVAMVLSKEGFTVHAAATFREAKALLGALGAGLSAVVAHGDMPSEPRPGTLLRLVRTSHPEAALVVLSARSRKEIGSLPSGAVLLREPFDRAQLLDALEAASDPVRRLAASDG